MEKYADLDLPLVPGEKVAYITEGADIVHRALVIATNKRLLLIKRGLVPSYTSLFYNTISLVHFKGGFLMPAVLLKLNGTGKLRAIRTRSNITAKSLFSILSNRVIIDHDVAMTYKAVDEIVGLDYRIDSNRKEGTTGILSTNMVEVVERIEEANGAFAEMVRMVENNVVKNAEARKAAGRELNAERIESLRTMVRGASRSALNTAAVFGSYRKPQGAMHDWIDFESAAKKLEKISISDMYDPVMFLPQSTSTFVAAAPGLGTIAARIEGIRQANIDTSLAEAQAVHEVEASVLGSTGVVDQQNAEVTAMTSASAGNGLQEKFIQEMHIFKIRSAREKLANM
ncbi:MAG: hypothetical protein ACP5MZ_01200 [Candidatus Micrarchaeia archaeon]